MGERESGHSGELTAPRSRTRKEWTVLLAMSGFWALNLYQLNLPTGPLWDRGTWGAFLILLLALSFGLSISLIPFAAMRLGRDGGWRGRGWVFWCAQVACWSFSLFFVGGVGPRVRRCPAGSEGLTSERVERLIAYMAGRALWDPDVSGTTWPDRLRYVVDELSALWNLVEVGEPFPGRRSTFVTPVTNSLGRSLVLEVWRDGSGCRCGIWHRARHDWRPGCRAGHRHRRRRAPRAATAPLTHDWNRWPFPVSPGIGC